MDDSGRIMLRGDGDDYQLDHVLASLKERGCSILVAGRVPIMTSRAVSHRLFGHPAERRERALIRLRQTNSLEKWFPPGVGLDDPRLRIIDCVDPGRSVAEGESGSYECRWSSRFDPVETPALTRQPDVDACVDELTQIVERARPVRPSQLRVGVFSLAVLTRSVEMVDLVTRVAPPITDNKGMIHFHLQDHPESPAVEAVMEHVDAKLTVLKDVPGEPIKQKWTIPGYGETPWLPL